MRETKQQLPYYEDDHCVIYNARCEDVLPTLTDVGLVLTSPPYNLNGDGHSSAGTYFRNLGDGYAEHQDAMPHDEYVTWQHAVLSACWDTLADDGAIFYNHKPRVRGNEVRLPLDLVPDHIPCRQVIVWDRGSGFNRQFTYFVPAHEWILMLARPSFRLTTRSHDDVWRIPFETGGEHPAPFPLRLANPRHRFDLGRSDRGPVHGERHDPASGEGLRQACHRNRDVRAVLRDRGEASQPGSPRLWRCRMTASPDYLDHLRELAGSTLPSSGDGRLLRWAVAEIEALRISRGHTRTSCKPPDAGPDYCAECSERAQDWVQWPCDSEQP